MTNQSAASKKTAGFIKRFTDRKLLNEELADVRSPERKYVFAIAGSKAPKAHRTTPHAVVYGRSIKARTLTADTLDNIIDEVKAAGYKLPVHVYATGNTAAYAPELYRFHHIEHEQSHNDLVK